eukprot:6214772-Prymnesium_polylepis.1
MKVSKQARRLKRLRAMISTTTPVAPTGLAWSVNSCTRGSRALLLAQLTRYPNTRLIRAL